MEGGEGGLDGHTVSSLDGTNLATAEVSSLTGSHTASGRGASALPHSNGRSSRGGGGGAEGPPAWEPSAVQMTSQAGRARGAGGAARRAGSFSSGPSDQISREPSGSELSGPLQRVNQLSATLPTPRAGSGGLGAHIESRTDSGVGDTSSSAGRNASFDAANGSGTAAGERGSGSGAVLSPFASRGGSLGSSGGGEGLSQQGSLMRPFGVESYQSRRSARRTSQSRFFSMLLGPQQTSATGGGGAVGAGSRVFFGLRVRMGVASGELPRGGDVRSSAVFDLAKGARARPPAPLRSLRSFAPPTCPPAPARACTPQA